MPDGNPFYVHPGYDLAPGLQGLSAAFERAGVLKREQEETERMEEVKKRAAEAIRTGDYDAMAEISVANPEIAKSMAAATGFKNKITEENYRDSLFDMYQNPTAENAQDLVASRQELLRSQGVGPEGSEGTDTFMQDFMTNPEGVTKRIGSELAFRYPERWKAMREATAPVGVKDKIYSKKNPDGSVRTIKNVKPGSEQEKQLIDSQFIEGSQTVPMKLSAEERKQERINKATDKLTNLANEDANKFYSDHSYRQNKDGSLFIDPVTGGPQELKSFEKVTGKRGNLKAIFGVGEQRDDAIELTELLELPSVQKNLKKAEGQGLWDQAKSKWNNKIGRWMQDHGIKGDSPTATAIARIQRMASEERKLFMGTAVTDNEMRSALAWMPNAGDSFDSVMNKTRLMGQEADQAFRRYVDVFESAGADMSPFMDAFGIEKFVNGDDSPTEKVTETTITQEEYDVLPPGATYTMDGVEYRKGQ